MHHRNDVKLNDFPAFGHVIDTPRGTMVQLFDRAKRTDWRRGTEGCFLATNLVAGDIALVHYNSTIDAFSFVSCATSRSARSSIPPTMGISLPAASAPKAQSLHGSAIAAGTVVTDRPDLARTWARPMHSGPQLQIS